MGKCFSNQLSFRSSNLISFYLANALIQNFLNILPMNSLLKFAKVNQSSGKNFPVFEQKKVQM